MIKKSKTRIFLDKSITSNLMIYIKNKQNHYLKNVLRIKINDQINIFDGISGEWETYVLAINRDNTIFVFREYEIRHLIFPNLLNQFNYCSRSHTGGYAQGG